MKDVFKKLAYKYILLFPVIIITIVVLLIGNRNFQSVDSWFGDSGFTLWTIDSNYKFLSGEKSSFTDAPIFYPYSDTFYFSDHLLPQSIIGLPLYLLTGSSIPAYNFSFLISFYLGFCGMYLLAKHKFKSTIISITLALLFTFNSFTLNQLSHFQLLFLLLLPFQVLFFEKIISGSLKWTNFLLFGILTICISLSNAYYLIFTFLLFIIYFLPRYIYTKSWKNFKLTRNILITGMFVLILISIFSFKYLEVSKYQGIERTSGEVTVLSSDLSNLFIPIQQSHLYFDILNKYLPDSIQENLYTLYSERSLYWGISITLLLVISLFYLGKFNFNRREISIRLFLNERFHYLLVIVFFILFGLGPVIKIFSVYFDIPTLYDLVYKIFPFINSLRAIGRSFSFAIFFAILTTGFGLVYIQELLNRYKLKKIMLVIVISVILLVQFKDTFSFITTLSNNLNSRLNSNLNKELIESKSKIVYFYPDLNNTEVISDKLPAFDVPIRSQILTISNPNLVTINGASGFFPVDTMNISKYIEKNGFNKSNVIALSSIGADTIVVNYEFIKPELINKYKDNMDKLTKEGLLLLSNPDNSDSKIYIINKAFKNDKVLIKETSRVDYDFKSNSCNISINFVNENDTAFGQKENKRDLTIQLKNRTVKIYFIEPIFIPEHSNEEIIRNVPCEKNDL